jgi:hypothetical protein
MEIKPAPALANILMKGLVNGVAGIGDGKLARSALDKLSFGILESSEIPQ